MMTSFMVNIGLGSGMLPDGTKLLPEPMLTYHWMCFVLPDGTKPLPEPMLTYHRMCFVAFTWGLLQKKHSSILTCVRKLHL